MLYLKQFLYACYLSLGRSFLDFFLFIFYLIVYIIVYHFTNNFFVGFYLIFLSILGSRSFDFDIQKKVFKKKK